MFEKDDVKFFATIFVFLILILTTVMTPILYLQGSAKAAYIKQVQNIEIPWFQAAWLEVSVNDVLVKKKGE